MKHHGLKHYFMGAIAAALPLAMLSAGAAPVDSPERIGEERRRADALIQQGHRVEASTRLLQALRAIPPDRTDLAPRAVGLAQALLFNTEDLMHPHEREAFYADTLDEVNQPMDLLLATLMRYTEDLTMTVDEAERCVKDLYKLTRGDHGVARLGALFTMSSPYFLHDTGWARRARDLIIEDYPDNALAVEAQRLVFYRADRSPGGLNRMFNAPDQFGELRAHSVRLREDAIGAPIYAHLNARGGEQDDAALAAELAGAASSAADWQQEYAALSIIADLDPALAGDRMWAAASEAIARDRDPRPVFRARTIRLGLARAGGDAATILEDAHALLDYAEIPLVYERNNYEEVMLHTQQSADRLAELGRPDAAAELLRRLAHRVPGSALAANLDASIESIAEAGARAADE
ncbi:MAG: hypothetical protein KF886_16160 [Candidatus Hydrogenedentes bacterium]|nr:hypothetical protein [Candidatus Hydrogenedentota bacterium]